MPHIGTQAPTGFSTSAKDRFSGDNSTTAFTLSKAVSTVNDIQVFVDNIRQEPTVAYSVSGTTLTFTEAPPTGTNNTYVVHTSSQATGVLPPQDLGTTDYIFGDDISLKSDGAIINFGADSDINITHVADTGLTTNGDFTVGDDLILNSDSSAIKFGADSEITLTHSADDGLILKHVGTADGKEPSLTFQAGDNDIAQDDVLGGIYFQAPDETTGTDAITVAARIEAVAETDFSSSVNKTSLVFKTADSGVADFSMAKLTSGGDWHLLNDGPSIFLGTNSDIELRHVHNEGLILKNTNTGNATTSFTIQTGDTDIAAGNVLGEINFQAPDHGDGSDGALICGSIACRAGDDFSATNNRAAIQIKTGNSETAVERVRVTSLGYTKLSYDVVNTATGAGAYHEILGNENSYVMIGKNLSSSGNTYWGLIRHTTAPDDNSSSFLYMDDGGGATGRCAIYSDGDVKNHDNSYGSLSDERIKQDIRDSNSQWDDIKAVKVRNFKKKDDVRQYGADKAWEQIGVVAQELETVSPKLIRNVDPSVCDIESSSEFGTLEDDTDNPVYYVDGDTIPSGKKVGDVKEYRKKVKEIKAKVKGVNYSILYMKAVKALQEAMTRIETLESKVKTLEDA